MFLIILLIIIVVLLFNSFSKFNTLIRNNENNVQQTEVDLRANPKDVEARYIKASSLMRLQKYPDAIREYRIVANSSDLNSNDLPLVESAKNNIVFCTSPLLWSGKVPEDKAGSYIHHLMLKYFGNSRNILTKS